ncbi:class I adenylate-forming enzyme family protein [Microbispora sp. H10836]|uniref:class I adenylate-forming enzyme family protein n=1 Tax=Microbispora sp. H10836 TaxID=2729106 RepID=UPI00147418E1|nr:class I adenylate-forming enzyme family protein [Microbispora sp. H10836]
MSLHDTRGSLGVLLKDVARRHPDRVAVVDENGPRTTYADLLGAAGRLANAFRAWGLRPGDRVAAWMDDSSEYVVLYCAAALAGLVVTPVNARYTVYETATILGDATPRVLVWSATRDGAVEELRDSGTLDGVRLLRVGNGRVLDASAWEATVAAGGDRVDLDVDPGSPFVIGYTSGTTGVPKGAVMTHRSVRAVTRQNAAAYRLPAHSVVAMTGSMSFVSVVPSHVLTHLLLAGIVVFMGRWDVPRLLDVVERERATFTYLPSPVLGEFAARAAGQESRWSSLRSILHSASKASPDALERLCDVVGSRLVEGWGMTENSGGLMTATSAEDLTDPGRRGHALSTVGRPIPGYDVRVVESELYVRGPGLVTGYWQRPEATAAAFHDGWFATGDVGSVDEKGYVTVLERRTDLIVSGGMNVYPAEVEAVIAEAPGVAEVAVVGVPHPRWGQTVVAVIVPKPGCEVDVEVVNRCCRARLASYKKPTEVISVSSLPTTVSLKVSRAAVRHLAEEHRK